MKLPSSLALVSILSFPAAVFAVDAVKPASATGPAAAGTTGPAAAGVAGTPAPGYSLANCVLPFDPVTVVKTSVGYQFWFADSAFAGGNTVKLSVVGPHLATHAPHRHAEDEFFFVVEGTAEFYFDGERKVAGPMTLFYCPSWHEHGIRNVGDTELKYLVLKKYLGPVPAVAADVKQVPGAAQPPAPRHD
jgi:mannose-6-phosphate isomerase-like protein (cupin superfamily)